MRKYSLKGWQGAKQIRYEKVVNERMARCYTN